MNLSFHSSLLHIGMISVAQGNNQSRQKIGYTSFISNHNHKPSHAQKAFEP